MYAYIVYCVHGAWRASIDTQVYRHSSSIISTESYVNDAVVKQLLYIDVYDKYSGVESKISNFLQRPLDLLLPHTYQANNPRHLRSYVHGGPV